MASGIRKSKDDHTPYWFQAVFVLAFRNTESVNGYMFLSPSGGSQHDAGIGDDTVLGRTHDRIEINGFKAFTQG